MHRFLVVAITFYFILGPPCSALGGKGGLPPDWILNKIEKPAGEKNMDGWTAAVFTEEQQARLFVDEFGQSISEKQDDRTIAT